MRACGNRRGMCVQDAENVIIFRRRPFFPHPSLKSCLCRICATNPSGKKIFFRGKNCFGIMAFLWVAVYLLFFYLKKDERAYFRPDEPPATAWMFCCFFFSVSKIPFLFFFFWRRLFMFLMWTRPNNEDGREKLHPISNKRQNKNSERKRIITKSSFWWRQQMSEINVRKMAINCRENEMETFLPSFFL